MTEKLIKHVVGKIIAFSLRVQKCFAIFHKH